MNYNKIKYIVLIIIGLSFVACKKYNLFTTKEKGKYLHCKIDGVDYYPEQDPQWNSNKALECDVIDSGRIFSFNSYNLDGKKIKLGVWDSLKVKTNLYSLSDNKSYSSSASYDDTPLGTDEYTTDSMHLGVINITKLDTSKKLVEGTFSYQCYNPISNKTANITDGEFSLYFNQ